MLTLRFQIDGDDRSVPLVGSEIRLGRSGENEIVLPDYSVSRRHASLRPDGGVWHVYDLKSTNGVHLNHVEVDRAPLKPGDLLKIGVFELQVEGDDASGFFARPVAPPPAAGPPPAAAMRPPDLATAATTDESVLMNATIIRSLRDFNADYGLEDDPGPGLQPVDESSRVRASKRKALDEAYGTEVFGHLTRLARNLIHAESLDVVLERVMAVAFEALPVDRGFILLRGEHGELVCELMRDSDEVHFRPRREVPISRTMLETVMREKVALMTFDALADQRLAGTESVRIHQIRAAMCAPLWSGGEKIVGVMQVDTPHHAGSFTEPDVDLLTTLANLCAVALDRILNAQRIAVERQLRSRLERYHSPGVIEAVMRGEGEAARRLERAEASVLFADIVGFTAFSENASPETVAELLEGYFTHAVEAIFSAGGTLDKFIGDCVMAFFGAPMAQHDHAQRALRAALGLVEALEEWNSSRRAVGLPEIQTRIGINSGPVVVGDVGSNRRVDYTVLGNTVNVAARLEAAVAQPGEIVIGEATRHLVGDSVRTEPLGARQLKGLSQRIGAYRVLRTTVPLGGDGF